MLPHNGCHDKKGTDPMTERDNQDQEKDLGTQGQEDTVKGKLNEAAGKVQSKVGELTGNEKMKAKGDAKQLGGKAQSTLGKGEKKVDQALNPERPSDSAL
jgi:uncharacterized protein YjbJ (UPF0337 family)